MKFPKHLLSWYILVYTQLRLGKIIKIERRAVSYEIDAMIVHVWWCTMLRDYIQRPTSLPRGDAPVEGCKGRQPTPSHNLLLESERSSQQKRTRTALGLVVFVRVLPC